MNFKRENGYVKKYVGYDKNTYEEIWNIIATEFWVKTCFVDLIHNKSKLVFGYISLTGETKTTELICRSMIADKEIIPLLVSYGINVYVYSSEDIMNYIYASEENDAEFIYAYSKLGWDNNHTFLSNKIISYADRTLCGKYIGNLNVGYSFNGSPDIWYKGIEKLVIPYTRTCLAFTLSYLSVVVSLLKDTIDCPEVFIEFSGVSSKGKTTMLMLAASVWGNPDMSEKSIIGSANATQLALETRLADFHGVPVFIDETTTIPSDSVNRFIYNVTSGYSKSRCSSSGELSGIKSWSGALLTTSEESIRYKSDLKDGANVRSIFIDFVCTNSAQHASEIKELVTANYGFGNIPFVIGVMDVGKEKLKKRVIKEAENFIDAVKDAGLANSEFLERRAKLMGAIMTTAFMLKHVFRFKINFGELRGLLLTMYDSEYGTSDNDEYERLKQLIYRDKIFYSNCLYGKFQTYDKQLIAYVTTTKFDEYCNALGIQNNRAFLAQLKKNNVIFKHDKGRNTCRIKINGSLQNTYALILDKENLPFSRKKITDEKGSYDFL